MGTECRIAFAQPSVFQEPVHVNVGKERTDDTALRRATSVALTTMHAPGSILVPLFDRRLQLQFNQPQHLGIHNPTRHRFDEVIVRD
jgi:hypothetical protein